MGIAWILVLCFFSYTNSKVSVVTHSQVARTDHGRSIPCSDMQQFNTARLPQQCIKLNGSPKQLRFISRVSTKGHYIKVVSDKNVSEFIIRKEDCCQKFKNLLTSDEKKAFANNKIVRFYHKNTQGKTWSAIATIPEQQAHKIISKAVVCPDGSIQL